MELTNTEVKLAQYLACTYIKNNALSYTDMTMYYGYSEQRRKLIRKKICQTIENLYSEVNL